MIKLKPANDRGFLRGEFIDRYGAKCSIQKSSLATEDCIWLGQNEPTLDQQGKFVGCRMHLTRAMAADLVKHLQRFISTGELH